MNLIYLRHKNSKQIKREFGLSLGEESSIARGNLFLYRVIEYTEIYVIYYLKQINNYLLSVLEQSFFRILLNY